MLKIHLLYYKTLSTGLNTFILDSCLVLHSPSGVCAFQSSSPLLIVDYRPTVGYPRTLLTTRSTTLFLRWILLCYKDCFVKIDKLWSNCRKMEWEHWELHSIVRQCKWLLRPGRNHTFLASYHSRIIAIVRGRNYNHVRSLFHSLPGFDHVTQGFLKAWPSLWTLISRLMLSDHNSSTLRNPHYIFVQTADCFENCINHNWLFIVDLTQYRLT